MIVLLFIVHSRETYVLDETQYKNSFRTLLHVMVFLDLQRIRKKDNNFNMRMLLLIKRSRKTDW